MHPKSTVRLMAVGLATTLVAWSIPDNTVAAGGTEGECAASLDSDGDFLPDAVEWVMLTNAHSADTDADGSTDFVEVVEAGLPRHSSPSLPADQQMRLILTGPSPGSSDPRTWMHVFHRVMTPVNGAGVSAIQTFDMWLEGPLWPGLEFPLNAFASGEVVYRERSTPNDGIWIQLSIPLVSEALLHGVLPCTICTETTVSGQVLTSGQKLINAGGSIASLVPYSPGLFVLQTLTPFAPTPLPAESNRVCVLEMQEQSTGVSGTSYLVVSADCEDANELECSASCQASVGWNIIIPGGTQMIGGN